MKIFICIASFLLLHAGISFAQKNGSKIPRQIFTTIDQAPEFPGGPGAMNAFLAKNIRYPKNAAKHKIQGKVVARFVVETNGSVTNAEIMESVDPDCDKETLRVIDKMPRWNPGRQKGVAAASYYTLPVYFKLN
jgi:protein TonB